MKQKEFTPVFRIKELIEVKNAQEQMKENTKEALAIIARFEKDMDKEEYLFLTEYINEGLFNFNLLAETYRHQILNHKNKIKDDQQKK